MHSFDRTMLASLGFSDPDKGDPTHDLACQYLAIPENQLTLGRRFSKDRLYCHAEADDYFAHLKARTGPDPDKLYTESDGPNVRAGLERRRPVLEYVISKGEGKYKTTVGFIDLRLEYARKVERAFSEKKKEPTFKFTDDKKFEKNQEAAESLGMAYEDFLQKASAASPLPPLNIRDDTDEARLLRQHCYSAKYALREHQAFSWVTCNYVNRGWEWFTLNVEVKANPVPIGNVLRQIKLYAEYVEGKWLLATTYPLAASDVSALNSCNIGHVALGDRFAAWAAEQRVNDQVEMMPSTFVL